MKTEQPFTFPATEPKIGPAVVAVVAIIGMMAWKAIALAPYLYAIALSVSFP